MSSAIRTIIRWSERNGGRLTMKRYKADTKARRRLDTASLEQRHLFHMRHYKPKEQAATERKVAAVVQAEKNKSIWQKLKNLLRRGR